MSSETQVVDVTTTIKKEIKPLEGEKVEATKHLDSTELSGTTSRSTDEGHEDKHDNDYLVGGNSEAVSITSSRLLEEYPSSHYLKERASTAQMSTVTFQMNSTSEKELLEKFGQCTKCNQPNTGEDNWCRSCNSLQFRSQFDYWSSGNENVNKIIRNAQLSARSNKYVLEWIPFNKFQDVKYVSKGGFGTVYSAYWVDGYILGWDNNLEQWQRHGTDMVALKRLYNSKFITMEFLNQIVKVHLQLHDNSNIVQYYGITQYPETDDYMIVMEYAVQGSIRSYLNGRFNTMNWYGKMNILSSITRGLEWMHESGYIHYNLHVGNILRTGTGETIITDVGIKKPTIKFTSLLRDKVEIYGVLPYLAPEVLHSKIFSKESDIYAFGVMMNEIISGLPPFNNVAHDSRLAAEICRGSRPEIPVHTPRLLAELIQRCWETKPNNRPSAKELNELLTQWWNDLQNDQLSEINAQCKSCDEMSRNSSTFTPTPLLYVSHPEAVYHSRLLEFDDMPRIINTDRRSKLLNSFPYSESRQIDGQDNLEYQDDQDDHTSSCLCPFNYLLNWLHSLKKLKK